MKRVLLFIFCLVIVCTSFSQTITFTSVIETSSNDAEECEDGTEVDLESSDLELVNDGSAGNQTVGVRFLNVNIPIDAEIVNAYIQFTADGDYDETTNLLIKGEYSANSLTFIDSPNNISSRLTTSSFANWDDIVPWEGYEAGENQRTPDLSEILTEVISNNGWQEGNPISLIITGTGKRKAFSFDGNSTLVSKLVVEYSPETPIYNDLAINEILKPQNIILSNQETEIEISLSNIGINSQSGFQLSYSIDEGAVVNETFTSTINSGETVNYVFNQTADLSEPGEYEIEVEVLLDGDENPTNNSVSKTITVVNGTDSLFFEKGSVWKYLDDGSNQGVAWQDLNFDDSDWKIGMGHMGFGEGDENTLLTPGFITYYFRKKVIIPDTTIIDSIYFNIVHDDGAVAYVNGREVLRSALMPSGTINYLTGTTTFIPNDVENDFWTYKVDKSFFNNGENIIAIEVHNQTVSSSDISFDCFVSDTNLNEFKIDGPYVFYRNGEIIVKTIEATGPQTYTYSNPEDVNLICRFQNGIDSFAVQLKPELNIEPSIYTLPEKFLAISDIEGNLEAFTMVLQDAGVMDNNYNWTFDDGHLIFLGDMFDRGNNVTECLWLLYRLENQAENQGGKIHFIIGNHDIMNLIYDFRYVAQKYINNVQLIDETLESLYADDTELGRWLRTKNVVERMETIIFVHAGLSPEVQSLKLTYDEINYWGRYRMDSICQTNECAIINGGSDYGVYWYRGMAYEYLTQQQVDDIVQDFDGEMVVIGHSVFDNISLLYEDKVICIDLDHKENFQNGFMSALYYENEILYDFYTDGTTQTYTFLNDISGLAKENIIDNKITIKVFPNPTSSSSTIRYFIPSNLIKTAKNNIVNINIINSRGIKVANIENEIFSQGTYSSFLEMSELELGVYYYQFTMNNNYYIGKIILIK